MAFTAKQMASIVTVLGIVSFSLAIAAEIHKPRAGTAVAGKDVVICKYPSNSVAFGFLSFVFLVASTVVGYLSIFYPYKGKSLPHSVFFKNSAFTTFFYIALLTAGVAAAFTLWPTILEQHLLTHKVYPISTTDCPIAKPGLIGGGAFVSLDASLMWIIALTLAVNVREDYFDDSLVEPAHTSIAHDVY